jgi:hypothetical protein
MNPRSAPKQFSNPDFTELKRICDEYIQEVAEGEYADAEGECVLADLCHYIFEAAIEALYGEEIWDFINDEGDDEE